MVGYFLKKDEGPESSKKSLEQESSRANWRLLPSKTSPTELGMARDPQTRLVKTTYYSISHL